MSDDQIHTVRILGDAGLQAAKDIAAELSQALAAHDTVHIATDAITGADITTIQLFLAASKQAKDSSKTLSLAAPPVGALRELLVEIGCIDAAGSPLTADGDFWTSQTTPNESTPA